MGNAQLLFLFNAQAQPPSRDQSCDAQATAVVSRCLSSATLLGTTRLQLLRKKRSRINQWEEYHMLPPKEKEGQLIPFLVIFGKPFPSVEKNFDYDEEIGLNMAHYDGEKKAAVLLPDSIVRLKTHSMAAGAGED
jgi:hypothetical protein